MDLKARERSWLQQLDVVFKDESTMGDLATRGRVGEAENSLKNLLHKRLKIWWNKAFLEKYLQRSLVPRGLRIQVFPSFPMEDETFVSRWEEVCTNGSFKFMELLIGHNKKILEQLEIEIEKLQTQIKETSTPEMLNKFNQSLEKLLDGWEKEIQDTKSKKFARDINDFQQKRMYRWRQKRPQRRFTRSSSVSSATSSQGEANQSSNWSMKTRYGKKKYNGDPRNADNKRKQDNVSNAGNELQR